MGSEKEEGLVTFMGVRRKKMRVGVGVGGGGGGGVGECYPEFDV